MTEMMAVKFADGSTDVIEGLILPFGGPMGGKDLTRTYFTPKTDFAMKWFPQGGRPGLYRHGFDPATKTSVIGREISTTPTERGYWLKAQLDASHEYAGEIRELINQGKLFLSSGAVDHLVDVKEKTGEIRQWPYVEWSLTPRPANPDQPSVAFREAPAEALAAAGGYAVKSLDAAAHLAAIGVRVPRAIKSWLPEGTAEADLEDADFAWLSRGYRAGKSADGRRFPHRVKGEPSKAGWREAWRSVRAASAKEFRGGPSRAATLRLLLSRKPKGVEVAARDLPAPIARKAVRLWIADQRRVKEGRRNSGSDASQLQSAHDSLASVLSLDCAPTGAGKEAPGPLRALAFTAGGGSETAPAAPDPAWLADIARQTVKEMTGR